MADRRSFLRGLASLPLIGGSVAILGRPTAAAVPVTPELLERYSAWLAVEYGETLIELAPFQQPNKAYAEFDRVWRRQWCQSIGTLQSRAGDRFAEPPLVPPSSRAAVILSAAGLPLTGGLHV